MNAESLFQAVKNGDLAKVKRFLKRNPDVDVDVRDSFGHTALTLAIWREHKPIIEVLLDHGAAVNGGPLQQACFHYFRCKRIKSEIVSLLLERGADVDALGGWSADRKSPLTGACNSGADSAIIQLLLNAGADVNGGGIAPLHHAAANGNNEAIDLLIEAGADVNRVSSRGFYDHDYCYMPSGSTPLHYVAYENRLTCVTTLLTAGADPNIANAEGVTPLLPAADYSSVEVVNALLAAGGDALHQDNAGCTPLQHFHWRRHFLIHAEECNIVTALVAAGDRSWECVPTPCPGLEAAMLSVWQAAPDELPELVKRMENPPQTLIELYARMDDEEMKKVVQEVLRGLHHHFADFPHLKDQLLNFIFGVTTV